MHDSQETPEHNELADALGELRADARPGDRYRVIPVRELRRTIDAIRPHVRHRIRVLIVSTPNVDRLGLLRLADGDIRAPGAVIEHRILTNSGVLVPPGRSYHLAAVTTEAMRRLNADLDMLHALRDCCRLPLD